MTLLLSHIPKTAGTSLKTVVARSVPETTFIYGNELKFDDASIDFLWEFRRKPAPPIVMGHFSYGAHRLLGLEPNYATVIREPVSRVISLHHFWKSEPVERRPAFVTDDQTLDDFVRQPLTEQSNNHMCRIIAGVPFYSEFIIDEDWLLKIALHNLERYYSLVAVVEELGAFVDHLARSNWGAYALPFENRSRSELLDIPQSTLATIAERNALDIKLYDYVRSRGGVIVRDV